MMNFNNKAEGIPHYISMLEEAQATSTRAGLPITDNVLVALANWAMISAGNYTDETKVFNKRPGKKQT